MGSFLSTEGVHNAGSGFELGLSKASQSQPNPIMVIPYGDTLPAVKWNDGQLFFVRPSGQLAMTVSGAWRMKSYDAWVSTIMPFSGFYPSDPAVSGKLQEWLEPSGIQTYDVSGVHTWERNAVGILANYSFKWVPDSDIRAPFINPNTLNGWSGVYFNGLSGIGRAFEPASAMNQGGNDQPLTVIMVVRDDGACEIGQNLVGFSQSTSLVNFINVSLEGTGTAPELANTIQFRKRDGATGQVQMYAPANSRPKGTAFILSAVHSGTTSCIAVNGWEVAKSGMNVASVNADVAAMGALQRSSTVAWCSGVTIWESMHFTSGLTDAHRWQLENYLSWKYQIPLAR